MEIVILLQWERLRLYHSFLNILCCICILSSGLGGLVMPTGDNSDSSESESSAPESSDDNPSSEEPTKGGFSFFN